jgi:hypothetical protein
VRLRGSCCRGRIVNGLEMTICTRETAVRARTARSNTRQLRYYYTYLYTRLWADTGRVSPWLVKGVLVSR